MALSWDAQPLSLKSKNEMVSSAVTIGTIQLLPNGQLLTLMADHQTVGGYPRVLQVIRADLPILAQLAPGSIIRFVCTDIEVAFREGQQMKSHLQQIANAVRLQMAFG
jgi:antagonist of KipI